ncbi:hypothetical protein MSG_02416 [Mycobacterium shigaense]|uniref:Uncharacterized protein n=1 Tax=Mycobacterium shigaense TaxID=722731 RepID=A0A1Z4EI29_9MYCO|nr:hypothetical protein B2J96_24680 [Mycobacterium shigaense]BAX92560.1 hypothetical protein MSG_02416 [Mycobacterium shigaense]
MLGFDVFLDVELNGPPMEVVTGEDGARGRMIGKTVVDLLEFRHRSFAPRSENALGYNRRTSAQLRGYAT